MLERNGKRNLERKWCENGIKDGIKEAFEEIEKLSINPKHVLCSYSGLRVVDCERIDESCGSCPFGKVKEKEKQWDREEI